MRQCRLEVQLIYHLPPNLSAGEILKMYDGQVDQLDASPWSEMDANDNHL